MAIRVWKGRKKPFQVYWQNPITKKQESASYATMPEAQKAEAQIKYRLAWEKESFRLAEEPQEETPDDSLETIDALYLQEKKPSYKVLLWHLDGMKIPLEMLGRCRIGSITRKDMGRVLARLQTLGTKSTTVRGRMKVFFTVMRWALKRGYIDALPLFPELPQADYEHFVPPTPEEALAIYEHAPDHIRRVIILGSKVGVRVGPSELFKLRWEHVDLARRVIRVQAAKKNHKEPWREVPIKDSLMPVIQYWHDQDWILGIPWVISFNGKQVQSVKHAWTSAVRAAGISRNIRPYDLRHAFATDMIAAGADVGTVAKLMGHTSPQMVLTHYQHVMTKQKKAAIEALPDMPFPDMPVLTKEEGAILQ